MSQLDPSVIVAHRGLAARCPENTLSAVQAAIDCGARFVEVDVQMSVDGTPVLFHDEALQRLCDVPGRLQDLPLAAIRELRAAYRSRFGGRYADERIATLHEFATLIDRHPGVTAFVEIKPEAVARHGPVATLGAVRHTLGEVMRRCVLISFDVAFLVHLRRVLPNQPIAIVVDEWQQLSAPVVIDLRAEYAFCDLQGLPASGVLEAPGAARVVIYEVSDIGVAHALAARGIAMFETFACDDLIAALRGPRAR